jgi:hypothetical protein
MDGKLRATLYEKGAVRFILRPAGEVNREEDWKSEFCRLAASLGPPASTVTPYSPDHTFIRSDSLAAAGPTPVIAAERHGLEERSSAERYLLTELHTSSGRDSQQISRSPNDILVKFVRGAVRIDNFPHHSNELASAIIVQRFVELASKAKEIDCVAIYGDRFFEQALR